MAREVIIKIWAPRWHDRVVLIGKHRVRSGVNKIMFTKVKSLKGKIFAMTGESIRSYPVESNGKIACYAVDLDVLLEAEE